MTVIINPYKNNSRSARALKEKLRENGVKTFIKQGEPTSKNAMIVAWGNSDFTYDPSRHVVVNSPKILALMTNKLRFFNAVGHDKTVPEWTTNASEAMKWNSKVLARTILEGSGGAGIVIWDPIEHQSITIPKAPLYVRYENKTHEYRIHMARGLRGVGFYPLLVQRKIFQKSAETPQPKSWEIRNHDNGFVYVQQSNYPTPECIITLAEDFMNKHFSGLHFAALDVIFHEKKNCGWILEGNTAPGLEGNTINVYAEYIATLHKEARA